jgi:hypothetical protein
MWMLVVLGGFGLVVLVTACIVADVVAGRARRGQGEEKTIGVVTRVRGPLRGQLDSRAPGEYIEVTVEYYTRQSEGPFEAHRKLPTDARTAYAKGDRVIVTYDLRTPRRGRLTGRIPSVA